MAFDLASAKPIEAAPEENPVTVTAAPQASQADVRKVDAKITPPEPPRQRWQDVARRAVSNGPLGPSLAISDAMDKVAYHGGGAVTDTASKAGLSPETSAALGVGANATIGAIPAVLGGAGGKLAAPAMQQAGRRVMQMALKPNKAARESGEAAEAIEYMLEKGQNVTKGGVESMTARIDELDNALTAKIANSKADVSTLSVLKPVKEALEKFKYGLDHAENQQAVRNEMLKFFDHPQVQQALQIPVQTAQKIKQAIYKEAGDKAYTFGAKSSAEQEGKKAVARGLKEGIERAEPAAADINKEMGQAINARDLAAERVAQVGNNNLVSLGWLGGLNPKVLIPWMLERSPLMASLGARGLYSGAEAIPSAAGAAAGATEGAVSGRAPKGK